MTQEEEKLYRLARDIVERNTRKPSYLSDDEEWYTAVEEARAELGITEKAPVCVYCGDVAPYGDARHSWISWHNSRLHIWEQAIKRKFPKALIRRNE